jgi:DNA-binding transcriptional LysR family regulator
VCARGLNAWTVEDELRSGKLVRILPEWDSPGAPPMVAIYRKTRPPQPQVSAMIGYLAAAFRPYGGPRRVES